MEEAFIKVTRYRDPEGNPTCCANVQTGEVCRFLGSRRMGAIDVCMLSEHRDLFPSSGGFQSPDDECLVWSAKDSDNKMRSALELIATPMRADGTWNRDRTACQELAKSALDWLV
jgi:hypothetical protein